MSHIARTKTTLVSMFDYIKNAIQNNKVVQSTLVVASMYIARELGHYSYRKWYSLPPGPVGYPLFGCIFNLIRDRMWLVKMATRFGPIFMFPMFGNRIYISDARIVKQLFIQKDFMNRRYVPRKEKQTNWPNLWRVGPHNTAFLINLNGKEWQKRRKHAQNTLFRTMSNKHVGEVLKDAMETDLVPYLDDLIHKNELWIPRKLCQYLAFNTLYRTMFGESIDRTGDLYQEMIADFDQTFRWTLWNVFVMSIKPLQYINAIAQPLVELRNRRNERIANLIKQRVTSTDNTQETFVDLTHKLVQMGEITKDEQIADTMIVFMAGTDTTSSTLDFGIALAAKNVEVQSKVRAELLREMKDGFDLRLVHQCPLFRAMVFEMIRIADVTYMGVQHIALERDHWVTLDDGQRIRIPAKTMVAGNMDYIHIYNEKDKNWKHTADDTLCLENFLDDGGHFKMNESFVAFGVGRRDCVGRQLALKEIQYIVGFILMHYRLSLDEEVDILKHRKPNIPATMFMSPSIGVRVQKI
eukprot:65832_1